MSGAPPRGIVGVCTRRAAFADAESGSVSKRRRRTTRQGLFFTGGSGRRKRGGGSSGKTGILYRATMIEDCSTLLEDQK